LTRSADTPGPDSLVRKYRPGEQRSAENGPPSHTAQVVPEVGGRKDGTEPTRFGDWEKQGRCIDF
jgi:hypothetical protein